MSKHSRYQEMVRDRTKCDLCAQLGLTNPANVQDGKFDGPDIGPWTRWNGNLNAKVLVVGQEWGDVNSLVRQKGLDNASATNAMLRRLLESIGMTVAVAPERARRSAVFLTNAALCLKTGGTQAAVQKQWFNNCAFQFLERQVRLVSPSVVVTLGERAYMAIRLAFSLPKVSFRRAANRGLAIPLFGRTNLVPVYHCGRRVLNGPRPEDQQFEDWKLVKEALAARHGGA